MKRWGIYGIHPVDAKGSKVAVPDERQPWTAPGATAMRLRWRAPGLKNPPSRSYEPTKRGYQLAERDQRVLVVAAEQRWPHDGTGWPVSPDAPRPPTASSSPYGEPQSEAGGWTVDDLVDDIMINVTAARKKKKTRDHYKSHLGFLKDHAVYLEGDDRGVPGQSLLLAHLDTATCQRILLKRRYTDARRTKNPRPLTEREDGAAISIGMEQHFYNAMAKAFRRARSMTPPRMTHDPLPEVYTRQALMDTDDGEDDHRRAERQRRRDAMTLREVCAVIPFLSHSFYAPHAMMMVTVPERVGELSAIDVDWFVLDTDRPFIRIYDQGPGNALKMRDAKDFRLIPLPDWEMWRDIILPHLANARQMHTDRAERLTRLLREAKREQRHDVAARHAKQLQVHQARVRAFPTHTGAPFDGKNFNARIWHQAVRAAHANGAISDKLLGIPFGELRHAAINDLMENSDYRLPQIARLAGNSVHVIEEHYERRTSAQDVGVQHVNASRRFPDLTA